MVSTLDFESSDPSSNLGRTSQSTFKRHGMCCGRPAAISPDEVMCLDEPNWPGPAGCVSKGLKVQVSYTAIVLLTCWCDRILLQNFCLQQLHQSQQDVGRMVHMYDIVPSDSSLPNQVQEMLTCEILVGREVSKTSCPG